MSRIRKLFPFNKGTDIYRQSRWNVKARDYISMILHLLAAEVAGIAMLGIILLLIQSI